jgi:phage tail tape-measure protein
MRNDIESMTASQEESQAAMGMGAGVVGAAGAVTGLAIGAKIGGGIGAAFGPIGTVIGAAAGVVVGAIGGAIVEAVEKKDATEEESRALDAIAKNYEDIGNAALTEKEITKALAKEGITDPKLIESLSNNTAGL